ncbi:hypothetical protein GCM10011579_068370 [Streptomyces albiflavescens]|uniref:Uncharacterized protein n=1 Tax=Streptomyces albiflavescens TaxID=1623582 RepID=A0A918D7L3_9ACTN|nr:hypothetical protein [Streptomyces albiflavescens]GGN81598.1 hypothetical protein GCM10011579_068370 [Streptomyces albiflavescens]
MVKPECQDIESQLQYARNELAIAQQDWLAEPVNSGNKQRLKKEVTRLYKQVVELEHSLRDCEGLPQYPHPVRALLNSVVSVSANASIFTAGGASNVPAGMTFSNIDYVTVEFTFPDTVVGTVVAGVPPFTVTNFISAKTTSTVVGVFERSTGHIDLPMARFDVRQSLNVAANGSVDFMPLTTRTVPSPMAPGGILTGMPLDRSVIPGRVILVGSSVMQGALCFNGTSVDLMINGVLSAFPPA